MKFKIKCFSPAKLFLPLIYQAGFQQTASNGKPSMVEAPGPKSHLLDQVVYFVFLLETIPLENKKKIIDVQDDIDQVDIIFSFV